MATNLHISLLGGLSVTLDGAEVNTFASRKAEALFAYLACNQRPYPRERVATLLWPDKEQSRALGNLSVALSSIRKELADYLLADRHTVAFNAEAPYTMDVEQIEIAVEAARRRRERSGGLARSAAAGLAEALEQYQGRFLDGFYLRSTPDFEAWTLLEQERLQQLAQEGWILLADFYQQRGRLAEGIAIGRQLLALDPLLEETHRRLMGLYAAAGQRSAALAQYEQCREILEEELGVEPDPETTALYETIAAGETTPVQAAPAAAPAPAEPRHNLSRPVTGFVGREAELDQIDRWLSEPHRRLITLIGPGGVGKTRLAQEAALRHLQEFVDGVWFVSLVPARSTLDLIAAVADGVDISLSGGDELATQLVQALSEREMLLLLDNVEHLLAGATFDLLRRLMEEAPELRLLVTSRERLNLRAESLLELRGLGAPAGHTLLDDSAAAELLVRRIRRLDPDFDPAAHAAAIGRLCHLVEGLPLALELAATWIRALPLPEIVTEVESGLDILSTSLRDVPERHRSMRAVFDTSWELLTDGERDAYRRLAVFRGGFTREAAKQVVAAPLPLLAQLVDKSLLRLDDDGRYRRHPLLLQFAGKRLAEDPEEAEATRERHAAYFAGWLAGLNERLDTEEARDTLSAIGADLDNVRAAWRRALAAGDEERMEQMVTPLGRFFADRSRFLEGVELFQEAQAELGAGNFGGAVRAQVEAQLGDFLYHTGRFADARQTLEGALGLAREHASPPVVAEILKTLGDVVSDQGEWEEAIAHLQEALAMDEDRLAPGQRLVIMNSLANVYVKVARYDDAEAMFRDALVLARDMGNELRIGILYNNLAIITNRQENYRESIRLYEKARSHFEALDYKWGISATSQNIGMALVGLEKYEEGRANIERSLELARALGHRRAQVGGTAVLGTIMRKQGRLGAARRHMRDALRLALDVGVTWAAMSVIVDVAETDLAENRPERAAMMLAFAAAHPAIEASTRENAERLLEELRAELLPPVFRKATQLAEKYTLEGLAAELLADTG